ncbi:MAG: gliding motility-associated C-terminal domain-containing protein [Flavobacteriaceae bacterium]
MIKKLLSSVLFLCSFWSFAQLDDFTLQVDVIHQTCLGNGSLTFTVSDTQPGSTMDYAVYLLPNTTTPMANLTTNTLTGLVAGTYLVVATQSLGGGSGTQQQEVTIDNLIVPLTYVVQSNIVCPNDGVITVNVTSGNPASYEIFSGPVIVAPQASNTFENLSGGTYQIRVYDDCGEAVVQAHTIIYEPLPEITLLGALAQTDLISCTTNTTLTVVNVEASPDSLPFQVQYTIYPPDGSAPIVQNAGTVYSPAFGHEIPFYLDQEYFYDVQITDFCGNVYTFPANAVNSSMSASAMPVLQDCVYLLEVTVASHIPPFTLNFTSYPDGFNPALYNAQYPGPYTEGEITFGSTSNPLIEGNYSFTVTDSCGRTKTVSFEIDVEISDPNVNGVAYSDCSGLGEIIIGHNNDLATVILTQAPDSYPYTLPYNVPGISGNTLQMEDIPLGYYAFEITDVCGNVFTVNETITPYPFSGSFQVANAPGCSGFGSVRLTSTSGNQPFSAFITQAPDDFPETLPLNISANIHGVAIFNAWFVSMNGLVEGDYTFVINDGCGEHTVPVTVIEYEIALNELEITENCGSFELYMEHQANHVFPISPPPPFSYYRLEKLNETTGVWQSPSGANYPIQNFSTTYNIPYSGQFRIVKNYEVYGNGGGFSPCEEVIFEFYINGGPQIVNIEIFPCAENNEAVVEATGIAPLQYSITTKNGEPFVINNGTNNTFSNLEPAIYNFQVMDACGNIMNGIYDVYDMPSIEITATEFCNGAPAMLSVINYSFLDYQWYVQGNETEILSTTNQLVFDEFNSEIHATTYVLNVSGGSPDSCLNQTILFEIEFNLPQPNAGEDLSVALCHTGEEVDLFSLFPAEVDDFGIWEDLSATGMLNGSMVSTENLDLGTYLFKYSVTIDCVGTAEAVIELSLEEIPQAPVINTVNPVCEGELLEISLENPNAQYTYSWTAPDGTTTSGDVLNFAESVMQNSGTYFVVAQLGDCVSEPAQVLVEVKPLPDFAINGNTIICENQSSILSVEGNFNNSEVDFVWYFNNTEIENLNAAEIEIFEQGNYSVEVIWNGCSTSESIEIIENTDIILPQLHGECVGNRYVVAIVNNDDFPDATFYWTGPSGFWSEENSIDITEQSVGLYQVVVTDALGCESFAEIFIESTYCEIQKGVSADGDGLNDYFDLSNFNVKNLKIYNRYGRMVYQSENYNKEWNGQSSVNGKMLPTATYYYVVHFADGSRRTGWVYLLTPYS